MTPGRLDLEIPRGVTFRRTFVWKAAGVPVPFSRAQARVDGVVELDSQTGQGFLTLPAVGTVVMVIPAERTRGPSLSRWVLQVEKDGEVVRLLEGRVRMTGRAL
jgi:hypothetical protein